MSSVKERSAGEKSRMNFRLSPEIKERVVKAATIIGQDLTEFAVATLNERAVEIIEKHDHLLLGSDDYKFFLDALDTPDTPEISAPSLKSRMVAERYLRGTRKGVRYHLAD